MVEATIRAVDPKVSFKAVHASRGRSPGPSRWPRCTSKKRCITSAAFPVLGVQQPQPDYTKGGYGGLIGQVGYMPNSNPNDFGPVDIRGDFPGGGGW
jgi:hypothetical protein